MRTGVLADSNNSFFQPMDHVSHERHLGLPHIAKHTRTTRKRKQGYRSTPRPRAPYMAHYELAQLMNPENPRGSLEAFSTHMEASQRPNPPANFKMLVEDFKRDNPSYVSRHRDKMLLDETAYFLQKTGLNPDSYFQTKFGNLSRTIAKPLHIIYERAVEKEDQSRQADLEAAYEESMHLLLNERPPEPDFSPYSPYVPPPATPAPNIPTFMQGLNMPYINAP
jgi:hypothetical protein